MERILVNFGDIDICNHQNSIKEKIEEIIKKFPRAIFFFDTILLNEDRTQQKKQELIKVIPEGKLHSIKNVITCNHISKEIDNVITFFRGEMKVEQIHFIQKHERDKSILVNISVTKTELLESNKDKIKIKIDELLQKNSLFNFYIDFSFPTSQNSWKKDFFKNLIPKEKIHFLDKSAKDLSMEDIKHNFSILVTIGGKNIFDYAKTENLESDFL